jgi:2-amino-4-hydroxy-6-hydroxymethyldihydropteridine diphosphokinase
VKTRAVLALGGNLGDRWATINGAIEAIGNLEGVDLVARSPLVETAAVTLSGVDESQPKYLNCVVLVDTKLKPKALLTALNQIENDFGRIRLERWAARTLDIDIISFGNELIETKTLVVPHPRAHERPFVLVPWALVDPEAMLPGAGSVAALAETMAHEVEVLR